MVSTVLPTLLSNPSTHCPSQDECSAFPPRPRMSNDDLNADHISSPVAELVQKIKPKFPTQNKNTPSYPVCGVCVCLCVNFLPENSTTKMQSNPFTNIKTNITCSSRREVCSFLPSFSLGVGNSRTLHSFTKFSRIDLLLLCAKVVACAKNMPTHTHEMIAVSRTGGGIPEFQIKLRVY